MVDTSNPARIELLETCGGLREIADRLTEKLSSFVELGPDTNDGNCARAFTSQIGSKLHSLAALLEQHGPASLEAKAAIAGEIFDLLLLVDSTTENFDHIGRYIKQLGDQARAQKAREAKAAALSGLDDLLVAMARRINTKRPSSTPNFVAGRIKATLAGKQILEPTEQEFLNLTDSGREKRLKRLIKNWKTE
jgi:hypothetical protein